jgi:hypothetical protein
LPSQTSHRSHGKGPSASTWFAVMSSVYGRKTSRNGLTPRISHIIQPRLQISDAYDKGLVGSNRVSGGRVFLGVNDCSLVSEAGKKAVPKSVRRGATWKSQTSMHDARFMYAGYCHG